MIAEGLSDALEITWSNKVAKRVKKTATQTAKGKVERWQNVETIFQINDSAAIKDKKVVVVDDVITTGATINAFAEALFEVGAKEIGVLAIASAE